jgi:hypothetical protein
MPQDAFETVACPGCQGFGAYTLHGEDLRCEHCHGDGTTYVRAVYADGGVLGRNPSKLGGTWAWCWSLTEKLVVPDVTPWVFREGAGLCLYGATEKECGLTGFRVVEGRAPEITNNVTEFLALARCLAPLPAGWEGPVYSDSQITLGRFFRGWETKGLPPDWVARVHEVILPRLGKLTPVLLDGHPTRSQLQAGVGKRGNLVSSFNKLCDHQCNLVAGVYTAALAELIDQEEEADAEGVAA